MFKSINKNSTVLTKTKLHTADIMTTVIIPTKVIFQKELKETVI